MNENTLSFGLCRLALIAIFSMGLSGCSEDIKCWPICSSSSSGVVAPSITVVAPSITLTYPTGGASLDGTATHIIKWTKTGAVDGVLVELYDGTDTLVTVLSESETGLEQDWDVTEPINKLYRIKLTSVTDPTVYDYGGYFQLGLVWVN